MSNEQTRIPKRVILTNSVAHKWGFAKSWRWVLDKFKNILRAVKSRMYRGDAAFIRTLFKRVLGGLFNKKIKLPIALKNKFLNDRIKHLVELFGRYLVIGGQSIVKFYNKTAQAIRSVDTIIKQQLPNIKILTNLGLMKLPGGIPGVKKRIAVSLLNDSFIGL